MPTSAVTRLIIAEDHTLVREGLKAMLENEPSFEVLGEASDGLEAVEMVEKEKPDVLLLDLRIPRLHGTEVLSRLRNTSKTKVLVVSMHSEDTFVVEAFKNGATGYVLKDCRPAELFAAIRSVAAGNQYLCEQLRPRMLAASLKGVVPGLGGTPLTKRELLVLELAAEGKTASEIAEALFISRRTAEAHRANLMRKLSLKTQTDLVLYAIRKGIIANP